MSWSLAPSRTPVSTDHRKATLSPNNPRGVHKCLLTPWVTYSQGKLFWSLLTCCTFVSHHVEGWCHQLFFFTTNRSKHVSKKYRSQKHDHHTATSSRMYGGSTSCSFNEQYVEVPSAPPAGVFPHILRASAGNAAHTSHKSFRSCILCLT